MEKRWSRAFTQILFLSFLMVAFQNCGLGEDQWIDDFGSTDESSEEKEERQQEETPIELKIFNQSFQYEDFSWHVQLSGQCQNLTSQAFVEVTVRNAQEESVGGAEFTCQNAGFFSVNFPLDNRIACGEEYSTLILVDGESMIEHSGTRDCTPNS